MSIIIDNKMSIYAYNCVEVIHLLWENNIVGQTIRSVRKAKGMSQEVLSGFAGIARTHLTMIECGTKQANFSTICKIAEAFDMRPSELVRKMEETEEKRDKLK